MSAAQPSHRAAAEASIWQDVEYGAYAADLPVWEELAAAAPGRPVLELGAGAGRVALHLARAGTTVVAADRDAGMVEELLRRAQGLPVAPTMIDFDELGRGDAWFTVIAGDTPSLAIAPLHVVQQVEPGARPGLLAALAELLPSDGVFAATLVDEESLLRDGLETAAEDAVPDMRDVDGWVYSSEPLWVQVGDESLRVRRLRECVDPAGEITRSVHDEVLHRITPDAFEAEAEVAGFAARERRPITSGPDEADSIAVILEAR
jgi:SAM-dependent methyltransferase